MQGVLMQEDVSLPGRLVVTWRTDIDRPVQRHTAIYAVSITTSLSRQLMHSYDTIISH